jgi:phage-related minor tail protein
MDLAVSLKSTFADFFTGLLNGSARFGDLWKGILGQINQMLGNIIAEFVWVQTIGSLLKKFLGPADASEAMKQAGIMQREAGITMFTSAGIMAASAAAMTMAANIYAAATGIPAFAAGGIVTRPTLALVGEAGPEMIVPLNSRRSERGSSGTTNVYLSVQALDARGVSDLLLRDGGKAVAAAVGAAVAGNSPIGRRR